MHDHRTPRWFAKLVGEDNAKSMPWFIPWLLVVAPFIGVGFWLMVNAVHWTW